MTLLMQPCYKTNVRLPQDQLPNWRKLVVDLSELRPSTKSFTSIEFYTYENSVFQRILTYIDALIYLHFASKLSCTRLPIQEPKKEKNLES